MLLTQYIEELQEVRQIPEGYESGFTFFTNPKDQEDISNLTVSDINKLFKTKEHSKGQLVHELWRIGRLETIYLVMKRSGGPDEEAFINIPKGEEYVSDQISEDDIVRGVSSMMKGCKVSSEECQIFLHDILCVSANVHDGQEFGETPLRSEEIGWKMGEIMVQVMEKK
ncbi:MAG: hypothetical protein HGA25_01215 [Clostridiales bacterium]|nr:hypothetical protein [Clostridiales bacterium]